METTVKERINAFIEHKKISARSFEARCGFSNGYLRQLRNSPTVDKMEMILAAYPELSREWLTTGEGEMIKPTVSQTTHGNNSPNISGDNNLLCDMKVLEKALDEISEMRKALCEAMSINQENTARLLKIVETMTIK